jgi:predicted double-glycine peptidase
MNRSKAGAAALIAFGVVVATAVLIGGPRDQVVMRAAARWNGARFVETGGGVRQRAGNDCGPAALAHALRTLGIPAPYPDPDARVVLTRKGCRFGDLLRECERYEVDARIDRISATRLEGIAPPAILFLKRGHFVVYEGWRGDHVLVHDPAIGRVEYAWLSLARRWRGEVMLFPAESRPTATTREDSPQEGGGDESDRSEDRGVGRARRVGRRAAGVRRAEDVFGGRRGRDRRAQLEGLRGFAPAHLHAGEDLGGYGDVQRVLLTDGVRPGRTRTSAIGPPAGR